MATSTKTLKVIVDAENRTAEAFKQVDKELKATQDRIEEMVPQFKKIGVAAGVAFAGIAGAVGAAVKAYAEAQAGQVALANVFKNTGKASGDQVRAMLEQAEALERVGVVQATSTVAAQKMLATFDLQASTIMQLTPVLLDYVVAEKGATASTQDFEAAANGLGKVMQGQFDILKRIGFQFSEADENLFKYGQEAQKVTRLQEILNSVYADANVVMRGTIEGGFVAMRNEVGRLSDALGEALTPTITQAMKVIANVVTKVADFISNNKALVAGVVVATSAITGMVAAFSAFLYVYPLVVAGIRMIGIAIGTALGPISLLISAIGIAAGALTYFKVKSGEGAKGTSELDKMLNQLKASTATANPAIMQTSEAFKKVGEEAKKTAKDIADVEQEITKLIADNADKQKAYKEGVAQAFVDQEQKLKDMQIEIANEKDAEQRAIMQNAYQREVDALQSFAGFRHGIELELVEMNRRATQTEFANKIEALARERIARENAFVQKREELMLEKKLLEEHLASLTVQQVSYTNTVIKEQERQVQAVKVATREINMSMASRVGQSMSSTFAGMLQKVGIAPDLPGRASGGPVSAGRPFLVGENGPEVFTPNTFGRISAVGSGGMHITITGNTFMGKEGIAEEIGDSIIDTLKRTMKL